MYNGRYEKTYFVMFVLIKFLSQTVSFGICQGVVFSHDKIHCLDPSKQLRALANLLTLASLTSQIQNAKLRLRLRSAFGFFNLCLVKNQAKLPWSFFRILPIIYNAPQGYFQTFSQTDIH